MLIQLNIKSWMTNFIAIAKANIKAIDIVIFLRQFATLIAAGVPLLKSCIILEKSQNKLALSQLIQGIKQQIIAGHSLYCGFKLYPQYFDELTCHMVYIGEQTGKLEMLLTNIAIYHEKQLLFRGKIKKALIYPSLIMLTACIVCLTLIIFVIPKFAELFSSMTDQLPSLTYIVFHLSLWINHNIYLLLLITVLLSAAIFFYVHLYGKKTIRSIIKQLPIIKSIWKKIALIRFCRHLAISFAAGIPLAQSLALIAKTNDDSYFSSILARLRIKINAGVELNLALNDMNYFPILLIQMIKIGEESGLLDQMLNKAAEFLETDIDFIAESLTQLLEPLIILILGVLIGGLVIAMYLPIFNLGHLL